MLYRPQKDKLGYIFKLVLQFFENSQDAYICNSIKHLRRTKRITDEDFHLAMDYLYSQMPTAYRFRRLYKHKLYNRDNVYLKCRFKSVNDSRLMNSSWWSSWYDEIKEESHRQRIIYLKLLIRNLKR